MAEPVHDDGVAVSEALNGARQVEGVIGDFVATDAPDDLAGFVVFPDAVAFAEGDEPVAVGELTDVMDVTIDRLGAEKFAVSGKFEDRTITLGAHEVTSVGRLAAPPHLLVGLDGGRQGDFDLLGDLAVATDLEEAAWAAFDHEHASVGERLAALDLGLRIGEVLPGHGLVRFHFLGAFDVAEEHVAVG